MKKRTMFDKIEAGGCEPPTKQFWVPVTYGATMGNRIDFPVCALRLSGDDAHMSFYTPDDFHLIVEAYVVVISWCTVAWPSWAAYSHYGKAGELYNTHTDNAWARPASCTVNYIYECDIIPVLDVLEAGDYVGISFTLWDDAHDVDVVGLMFKYD